MDLVFLKMCWVCREDWGIATEDFQSGGAYGFRDQLQDCFGIKYINSEYLRKQIINCARHQFIEGDVLHWWHNETKRGIRFRKN